MPDIDQKTIAKLAKLIPMLSSNHTGEVAATAAAIVRVLATEGVSLHDVVTRLKTNPVERVVEKIVYRERVVIEEKIVYREKPPEPEPAQRDADRVAIGSAEVMATAMKLLAGADLADHERSFIENMGQRAARSGKLMTMTTKQSVWFHDLTNLYKDQTEITGDTDGSTDDA